MLNMIETDWRESVWYSHPTKAGAKALEMSQKSADSFFIVKDNRTGMFGVGQGAVEPSWCRMSKGFELIAVIHPRSN